MALFVVAVVADLYFKKKKVQHHIYILYSSNFVSVLTKCENVSSKTKQKSNNISKLLPNQPADAPTNIWPIITCNVSNQAVSVVVVVAVILGLSRTFFFFYHKEGHASMLLFWRESTSNPVIKTRM